MTGNGGNCPECGVWVKGENLSGHRSKVHPRSSPSRSRERPRDGLALTRRGRALLVASGTTIAVLFLVLAAWPSTRPPEVAVGAPAPIFTLATSDGGSVSLSSLFGQPGILEFMSPYCRFCIDQAPVLASLYETYQTQVWFLSVVLVDVPEGTSTPSFVNDFRAHEGTPWNYAMDSGTNANHFGGPVTYAYGVSGTPTTFVLNAEGKITWIGRGLQSYAAMESALRP